MTTFIPSSPVELFNLDGLTLSAPINSFVANYLRNDIQYEPHVADRLLNSLCPESVFVDIGANVGFYALQAAKIVGPNGRVYAIEPDPINAQCLLHSRSLNNFLQLEIWPVAAGTLLEPIALLLNDSSNSGTRDLAAVIEDTYFVSVSIPLDTILARAKRVDVLKIDIESREYPALLGAVGTMRRFKPTVFAEFTPSSMLAVAGNTPKQYLDLMWSLGYEAEVLLPDGGVLQCRQDLNLLMDVLNHDAVKRAGVNYLDLLFKQGNARAS